MNIPSNATFFNNLIAENKKTKATAIRLINKSLLNIPQNIEELEWLEELELIDCGIEDIQYLPKNIKTLDLSNNITLRILDFGKIKLTKLKILKVDCCKRLNQINNMPDTIESLIATKTNINSFNHISTSLTTLNLRESELLKLHINKTEKINILPKTLKHLEVEINRLQEIGDMDDLTSLVYLDFSNNSHIIKLGKLPPNVKQLKIYNTGLEECPEIPKNVISLDICYNKLKELKELPETLESIEADRNELIKLPKLPDSLYRLIVYSNKLTEFPETLPKNLIELDISKNCIKNIPKCILEFPNKGAESCKYDGQNNGTKIEEHNNTTDEDPILQLIRARLLSQELNIRQSYKPEDVIDTSKEIIL